MSSVSYQNKTISVSKGRARRTPPPIVSELNALLRVAAPVSYTHLDVYKRQCLECGLCGYVCIARRPVLQYIRLAKRKLAEMERDKGLVELKTKQL